MKIAAIIVGSLLLLLGLIRVPSLLLRIGVEVNDVVFGRALFIFGEIIIGILLVVYGIRRRVKAKS